MLAPIFPLVANDSDCVALLGSAPTRFWPMGDAPQGSDKPYATWALITGLPENYMDCPPDIDSQSVQVDCWADTPGEARSVAEAIRTAVEGSAHVVAFNFELREPDTRLYRVSFTVDFWTERT